MLLSFLYIHCGNKTYIELLQITELNLQLNIFLYYVIEESHLKFLNGRKPADIKLIGNFLSRNENEVNIKDG